MTLQVTTIEGEEPAASLRAEWDALAVATSRPFCAPGWSLAWWRNAAPDGAGLRLLAVHDGGDLVGLAPLWAARPGAPRSAHESLAAHFSPPAGLLVAPGREAEVAESLAAALAEGAPRPSLLRLEDQLGGAAMAERILAAWPGRAPWVHATPATPLPLVELDGRDYEEWLAAKSSKFRQETRRLKRRLDDAGGEFRLVDADGVEAAVEAFVELHGARWEDRGGSDALIPGIRRLLGEAARDLLPAGRLRIYTIAVEGKIVAVNILLAAGEEVCGWNSGFDAEWGRYSPSLQLTLHALADAAARGEKRVNLGPGGGAYKLRMADAEGEVGIATIVPRGRGYAGTRLRLARHQARWGLSARLSPDSKRKLRRLARR